MPPSIMIQPEPTSNHLRLCRLHLNGHRLGIADHIAVRHGTDPTAFFLPPCNNTFHLFAGIGNGHLVDQKTELNGGPVVIGRVVDAVTKRSLSFFGRSPPLIASQFCPTGCQNPAGQLIPCGYEAIGGHSGAAPPDYGKLESRLQRSQCLLCKKALQALS